MNYQLEGRHYPILIKGLLKRDNIFFEVESLQDRIMREPLRVHYLYKIMFHITLLVSECQKRKPSFLKCLRTDLIYLNKDVEDPNIFIFEEDQLNIPQQQQPTQLLLFNLFQNLGFNIQYELFQKNNSYADIINELLENVFEQKKIDRQIIITETMILKELYNIKIVPQKIYEQQYSRVYLIEKPYFINSSKNTIIVKWVKFREEDLKYQNREIVLLEFVSDSQHCTKMFCYNNLCDQQFIFMPYYDETLDALNNRIGKKELSLRDLIHLIKQILLALKDLHSKNIIHRDLKPLNIMFEDLGQDKNIQELKCVLIDFGASKLSRNLESQSKVLQSYYEGTADYQPPEGTQNKYQTSYDIWQLGYIIQCLILRNKNKDYSRQERPMSSQKYKEIFEKDHENVRKKYPTIYPIVIDMMHHDPNKRPTLVQVETFLERLN